MSDREGSTPVVVLDGRTLTPAGVVAVAREVEAHHLRAELDEVI